jgi:chemotaxis protein methyltransferase CheR
MTDEEFRLLRDLITEYCGIYFAESFKYLVERRLQPRLPVFNMTSFREYYRMLKYGPDRAKEFDEIVERVTTNETYFFREMYQLKSFTDEILPAVVKGKKPGDRVRIWSAGCSTGEEPYSLAMLTQHHASVKGLNTEIFGNDISRKVLKIARAALYRESSFRQTEQHWIDRHFTRDGRMFKLNEDIKNRVTFGHLNLMDEAAMALMNNVDVIFCRNVIIYFAADARARLLDLFHKKLRPGGYLLLGHSESLINATTKFELMPLQHDIVYRRPM